MGQYFETHEPPFFLRERSSRLRSGTANKLAFDRPSTEIKADIEDLYLSLHGIDASKVKVTCEKNRVVLSGNCVSARVRTYLENLANNVPGVREVVNDVQLVREGSSS
jgi:osmotically-inducible protein OsmY